MSESAAIIGLLVVLVAGGFVTGIVIVVRLRPASGGGAMSLESIMRTVQELKQAQKEDKDKIARLETSNAEKDRRITLLEASNAEKDRQIADLRSQIAGVLALTRANMSAPDGNSGEALLRRFIADAFSVAELNVIVSDLGWNAESITGDTIDDRARAAVAYARRQGEVDRLRSAVYAARPGRRVG